MHEKGVRGEGIAAQFLTGKGYRVVARNYRSRRGEVDIVACKEDTIVFVEVKSWDALSADSLEHSLSAAKRRRILDTARWFLYTHPEHRDRQVRFDLIFVHGSPPRLRHLEGAFSEGAIGGGVEAGGDSPW